MAAGLAVAVLPACRDDHRDEAAIAPVAVVATGIPTDSPELAMAVEEVRLSGGEPLEITARLRCLEPDGCHADGVLTLELTSPTGPLEVPLQVSLDLPRDGTVVVRRQLRSAPTVSAVARATVDARPRPPGRSPDTEIYQ